MEALFGLSNTELRTMGRELRAGRIAAPYSVLALRDHCGHTGADGVAAELQKLSAAGMTSEHIATCLEAIAEGRARASQDVESVELVWTGPEMPGTVNRDTGALVRELFAAAKTDVLIAGFAVYQGKRIFQELAERMDQNPALRVRMFLNVPRGHTDTTLSTELLTRFKIRFKNEEWPGKRLPEVFYDPRSLETSSTKHASLHAKTVVIDGETAFVSSANFTEAAQERNIELGALIRSKGFATRVCWHFNGLASQGILRSLAL